MGGGFEAYRQNRIQVSTVNAQTTGEVSVVSSQTQADEGRAYHSAYFEMLGEQGFPGLILFLLIHGIGLVRMELIRRRYRRAEGEDAWIAPLATALQNFQLIYLVGAALRRHRLPAVRLPDDRHPDRLRHLAEPARAGRRASRASASRRSSVRNEASVAKPLSAG